jgi:hypothetical protein
MATTKTNRTSQRESAISQEDIEQKTREITSDIVEYLTEYARQNPGYTALFCLGTGFVLGWKLKPW